MPESDPRTEPALWSPARSPDVVVVESDDIEAILLPPSFEALARDSDRQEHHLVAARGAVRLRLCLRKAPMRSADQLVILRDECATIRLAAAIHFERVTLGSDYGPNRRASPSAYRRSRFVQMLAIHDALDAGVAPRAIAFGLVFPRHRPLIGATWKGSSERRHMLRLIADARRLVASGYRGVLLHD